MISNKSWRHAASTIALLAFLIPIPGAGWANTRMTTSQLTSLESSSGLTIGYNYWDSDLKVYKKAVAADQLQVLSAPSGSVVTDGELSTLKSSSQVEPNILYWKSDTKTYEKGNTITTTAALDSTATRKDTATITSIDSGKMATPNILYWDTVLKRYYQGLSDFSLDLFANTGNKTITVTFDSAPSTWDVTKAPLKYDKNFAWSFVMDDGYQEGYANAFKYFNGGELERLSATAPGKYFTDGAGNDVPFRGGYALYGVDSSQNEIHGESSLSYLRWSQIDESIDAGWDLLYHGYTPKNYLNDMTAEVTSGKTYIQNNTTSGYTMQHAIVPGGMTALEDEAFNDACYANGIKTIMRNGTTFIFDGVTHTTTADEEDAAGIVSADLDKYYQSRFYYYDSAYTTSSIKNHVDAVASASSGGVHNWTVDFTHRVLEPGSSAALNGNLPWDKFTALADHIEDTYGKDGNDTVWAASSPEVYEYISSRENTEIASNLSGNTLTITLDTAGVPSEIRRQALSLVVNADTNIQSITYSGGSFTNTSHNTSSGLINLDWGTVYTNNLSTHVENYVSQAESTEAAAHVTLAQTFVDYMDAGAEKTAFQSRIDAINVQAQKWQISFGEASNNTGSWNYFNGYQTGSSLSDITDSIGDASTVDIAITADFTNKDTDGVTTGDDSGVVPDAALLKHLKMYGNDQPTGKVRIEGLVPAANYNVTLIGSDTDASNDSSTTTEYIINGVTKSLQTSGNTTNSVMFFSVPADGSGYIEVSVQPETDGSWGEGLLSAMIVQASTAATCSDEVQNGNETGVDCGGSCSACPTCSDGIQNQDETGVDCGGATCSACPTCSDGLQNGDETGVDCGGSCSACVAAATTWNIDLGDGGKTMGTSGWNDITSYSTSSGLTDMVDSDNNITTVDLTITDGFQSSNNNGVGTDTGIYPRNAQVDTFYLYGGGDNAGQITLGDLDPAKTYDIRIFGSRNAGAPRQGDFTIDGSTQMLEAAYNTNDSIIFGDISPTAGGDIVIDVAVATAGNTYGGYIGVIELMEQ